MPEGVEIEIYRRAAEATVGRRVAAVEAPDAWFLKGGITASEVRDAVDGQTVEAARRKGKLLILDLSNGVRLGLRFGMTGRLIVDDNAAIDELEYGSNRNDPAWDRFALTFEGGGELRLRDPRRLGGVELDPDEDRLGPDAFSVTPSQLRSRVLVGEVAIKARLLDQQRISGIGNLIADETLWRAGIDPARPAGRVTPAEQRRLRARLQEVLAEFTDNGGSHTGRLQAARTRGGRCPKCGSALDRRQIGGRTTFSCPRHQP